MRGTAGLLKGDGAGGRITPACAGNRKPSGSTQTTCGDHPRVCGEQKIFNSCIAIIPDHPRVCGEQMPPVYTASCSPGSPPRVRGPVCDMAAPPVRFRITPACAGDRRPPGHQSAGCRDHPRVCGEQAAGAYRTRRGVGSPPRVRGTGNHFWIKSIPSRITPACAGNRIFLALALYVFGDHPRVCGEQKIQPVLLALQIGSPPRVRGTDANSFIVSCCVRITPACAGNREISAFMDIEL